MKLQFRPVGAEALLVEVGDTAAAQATYRVIRSLVADAAVSLAPPRDLVPAARTVLLDGVDIDGWRRALDAHAGAIEAERAGSSPSIGRDITLAIRYDGEDLPIVASTWGCTRDDVVRLHARARFRVAFCGFAPGFAYCTSDLDVPPMSRRSEPRANVPAGSVALAGEYCGIYPRAMPGGWQIVGSTPVTMFDATQPEPALLQPGDRVRFSPIECPTHEAGDQAP
jgi:allophanate hydrolase subunit 1